MASYRDDHLDDERQGVSSTQELDPEEMFRGMLRSLGVVNPEYVGASPL